MKAAMPIDLAPLRSAWERRARRIDALSLRERAVIFICIAAVLAALFDTLVLTPLSARNKLRAETQARQATEVAQLREQFKAASSNVNDPAGQLRVQLGAAQAERERLDAALRQAGSVSGGEALSAVLQRLLAQQPGLVLERLALLDDTPVAVPATPSASAPAARPAMPPSMPGMSWQGVELQVMGRYADIQLYLQVLERELPGLRWGEMHLGASGNNEPPRLRAQLFLLKVQP
jgi:MSHA biogenesis protein MshJ